MKILMINSVCGIRSTGRICTDLAVEFEKLGHTVKIAYGREDVPEQFKKYAVRIGNEIDVKLHAIKARMFDCSGFCSKGATRKFIKWIKEYDPDVIHLHNLHGYYINIEILFKYLKSSNKKIVWTLHDCWAFTGHCAYFDFVKCDRWKKGCYSCNQYRDYPMSYIDRSKYNWKKKKDIFSDIPNMMIVTPSQWLARLVNQSYMAKYPITVINNGIDISLFKKLNTNIKEKYDIPDKKVVLGVSAIWDKRKGLNYIYELAEQLDNNYQVVVIGITEEQKKILPPKVLGILRTNNVRELVEWYSAAEVFVNPTLEDNYPTTNLEAISCGTPVVTFRTGGSSESAYIYGNSVNKGDVNGMCISINNMLFIKKGNVSSVSDMAEKYIEIY